MDLREILFAQFPAFFLLSLLFLAAHLRVRKRSAVKSVLWVLLFGAALAVSILFCFLGMQAKYWTVKTLFELKFWSWLGLAIVVFVLVLRLVFKLQNKHAQHMVEKERAKAEKTREEAVKQAREEGRACSVVSSDGTIQAVVMGKGVTRISSRMLVDEIKQIDNDVHEAEEAPQIKMTLGSRLSPDALAKLKALRGR